MTSCLLQFWHFSQNGSNNDKIIGFYFFKVWGQITQGNTLRLPTRIVSVHYRYFFIGQRSIRTREIVDGQSKYHNNRSCYLHPKGKHLLFWSSIWSKSWRGFYYHTFGLKRNFGESYISVFVLFLKQIEELRHVITSDLASTSNFE